MRHFVWPDLDRPLELTSRRETTNGPEGPPAIEALPGEKP